MDRVGRAPHQGALSTEDDVDFLVIAHPDAATDWFSTIGLTPKKVHDRWSDGRPCNPPRVIVELPSEVEAVKLLDHKCVKSVEPRVPLTRAQVAERINEFYRDGSDSGQKAGDALLDLMNHLDKISKENNSG